ncbi:MAG: Uncharacterised protein [Hyphomonas sp. TMED17]|nr:MAG: Uncharacterised protein [Hyphomonas sp. TMED17]
MQAGLWDGRFEPSPEDELPATADILVRQTRPPGRSWRTLIDGRIRHETGMLIAGRLSDAQLTAAQTPIDTLRL